MDLFLIVVAFLLILVGAVGCVLPVLPGIPLAYGGLLMAQLTNQVNFSIGQLLSWLFLVIALQLLDYVAPMLGSKYSGGSAIGNRGCVAGTVLGLFFMPWGIIAGPFIGAVVGEILGGHDLASAIKAGIGTFLGLLLGVLLKLALCLYFLVVLIGAL